MNEPTFIIATDRPWNWSLSDRLERRCFGCFVLIDRKEGLTHDKLSELSPRFVFFPHWSYKIPSDIHERFECVVFHMTDVPYGRGGSPLQNLILRGHTETVISAVRCIEEMDAGPVFLKRPLSLYGTAEEIYLRATTVIEEMIIEIIENNPEPVQQRGEPVIFSRRRPDDGNLRQADTLEQVYERIRMLDAEGYPPAFIEAHGFRLEFKRASRRIDGIHADVVIKKTNRDPQA